MPPSRRDLPLVLFAAGAVVLAGVLMAAVLLFATSRTDGPRRYQPFEAGNAADLKRQLREGGPFFVADPFGGHRSILFGLEDGEVVALSNVAPGTKECTIRWRGSIDRFVDCEGTRLESTDLDRWGTSIPETGPRKGLLLVDLREKIDAPA